MRERGRPLESSGLAAFANAPGRALCPVAATIEAEVAQLRRRTQRPSARTSAWKSRGWTG